MRWMSLVLVLGAVAPGVARAEEQRLAISVDVDRGLKLSDSDLSRALRGHLGRYGGVLALPEGKTRDAIKEERSTINSQCKAGALDQKCQLQLGAALAASHWLQATVVKGSRRCEVNLECLSIKKESSDGSANVPTDCDRDAVVDALRQGLEQVAVKMRWGAGGGGEVEPRPFAAAPVVEDPNDPVAKALRAAESAKKKSERDAEEKAQAAAERQWPAIDALARDSATPLDSRTAAVTAYRDKYRGTDRSRDADALLVRLEGEVQQARAANAAAAEAQRAEEESKKWAATMVTVPGGEFWYGCNPNGDDECASDEKPGRKLSLPTFRIDRTEVTVRQYRKCVDAGRCSAPDTGGFGGGCTWGKSDRESHPVNCVSWSQARAFCAWAGKRLPSEQEWEKAARGTAGRKFPWGQNFDPSRAELNESGNSFHCCTEPVGSFVAGRSPYGALDMSGNVWEWCANEYSVGKRVVRGGSFYETPGGARASTRAGMEPDAQYPFYGFRCARSAD
jgi:formylglycine-generating enzyme required for sulfatase activity